MIDAEAPFRWMWDRLPTHEQKEVKEFFKKILEEDYWVLDSYDQIGDLAREDLNMIDLDEVVQIASEKFGMIDGPSS